MHGKDRVEELCYSPVSSMYRMSDHSLLLSVKQSIEKVQINLKNRELELYP